MVVVDKSSFWEHTGKMITCLDQSITKNSLLLSLKLGSECRPRLQNNIGIIITPLHRPTLYYFTILGQLPLAYAGRRHSCTERRVDAVGLVLSATKVRIYCQLGLARCLAA